MLATLVVGGGVAVANQKDLVLDVNGEIIHASTLSRDVEGALKSAGITLDEGAVVTPALDERVSNSDTITIRSLRQVSLTVDGKLQKVDTTALTVGDLMKELGRNSTNDSVSKTENTEIPLDGMNLELISSKKVTINDGGQEREVTVPARTVRELLDLAGAPLREHDEATPSAETPVTDGMKIDVLRVDINEFTEERDIQAPVRYEDDPDLTAGEEIVKEEGLAGKEKVTVKARVENGVEKLREIIHTEEITPATERVIIRGTKEEVEEFTTLLGTGLASSGNTGLAAPAVADGSVWDQLAQCESGGNWHINTGNGFSGGLQFHPQTWTGMGGGEYAPEAWQATREQQIVIAERVLAAQGWGAWPACSSKLGLR